MILDEEVNDRVLNYVSLASVSRDPSCSTESRCVVNTCDSTSKHRPEKKYLDLSSESSDDSSNFVFRRKKYTLLKDKPKFEMSNLSLVLDLAPSDTPLKYLSSPENKEAKDDKDQPNTSSNLADNIISTSVNVPVISDQVDNDQIESLISIKQLPDLRTLNFKEFFNTSDSSDKSPDIEPPNDNDPIDNLISTEQTLNIIASINNDFDSSISTNKSPDLKKIKKDQSDDSGSPNESSNHNDQSDNSDISLYESITSSDQSPNKSLSLKFRKICVPETPDEKLKQKRKANLDSDDDEVIPQTPIGKIKQGLKFFC